MPESNTSFVDEARAAARGVFALVVGDRGAARHFDFSQRGLVSSFIALLAVMALNYVAAVAAGVGGVFASAAQFAILYGAFTVATALYLRRIARNDALVPFIATSNWTDAVYFVVISLLSILGLGVLAPILLIAGVVLSINIARLVMTLRPLQIVLMIVAQAVGVVAAALLIIMLFPPTPEQLAEIAAAASR